MGWSIGYDTDWDRDIGYGVPAICDHPKCKKEIDRGLGYVCGGQPYGGEKGCGLYFCGEHLSGYPQLCERCRKHKELFKAKPDLIRWVEFKLTDESWKNWRTKHKKKVQSMKRRLRTRVKKAATQPITAQGSPFHEKSSGVIQLENRGNGVL
jgi:hypothetical protein